MNVHVSTQAVQEITGDVLIVGAARQDKTVLLSQAAQSIDKALDGLLSERSAAGEFQGQLGELLTVHPIGRLQVKRVLVVGLGALEKATTQSIRRASAIAANHAQKTGTRQLYLALDWPQIAEAAQCTQAATEGALLGLYTFRSYQSASRSEVEQVTILVEQAQIEQAVQKGRILAEAANFARDLVNEPPCVLTPTELAQRAQAMAQQVGIACEIFDKEKITELGMGGLLGVSRGSARPPQFIILRYRGAPDSAEKGLALVGKGITFDTGGISIKPAPGMDEMKGDMAGAAAVIGAMQAIALLKPAINVTALVPTCENMPSGTSYLPGDILRILNGKTIEIVNTDAEGRLILADALSYAVQEELSPIIDLATLTGGIVVALGAVNAGLFSNDEQLTQDIIGAGRLAGEKYWAMPMDDEYLELIHSDIADIKQSGGRPASSISAAKILQQFVGTTSWAHLDIAGTSYSEKKPYQEKGATGMGVRTLVELVLQMS